MLVAECVEKILSHIESLDEKDWTIMQRLAFRLHEFYENDVGIIFGFLLNDFVLQPGESLVLGPNEPHAYIRGEAIECVAASDNVVRGGLTPKFKDSATLIEMLTYSTEDVEPSKGTTSEHEFCKHIVYNSGFKEFNVHKIVFPASAEVSSSF